MYLSLNDFFLYHLEEKLIKNKSKKLLDNNQTDQEDQEDDSHLNLLFNCRLCRLKFNNRRGLHEHVARSLLILFCVK